MTRPAGRVVVFGSANVDRTLLVARPPGPGETLLGSAAPVRAGGKGLNQAVAAARMGVAVAFHGTVGDDGDGEFLIERMRAEGVDVDQVQVTDAGPTGLAVILLEPDGANRIVVAHGANTHTGWDDGAPLDPTDLVVAQLEVPTTSVRDALGAGRRRGATTVLNAAPADPGALALLDLVDVLVVNEPELEAFGGWPAIDSLTAACEAVVVTQGAEGATVAAAGREHLRVPADPVDVVDTTGAGDCFVGVLAACLMAGAPLAGATLAANTAAGQAVGRAGAADAMPTADALGAALPPALRVPSDRDGGR